MSKPESFTSAERSIKAGEAHSAAAGAHAAFHAEVYGGLGSQSSPSKFQRVASNDAPKEGDIVHNGTYLKKDGTKEPVIIIETPHEFI